MNRKVALALLGISCVFNEPHALAQLQPTSPISALAVDLATPEAPALAALDVTPEEITRPRTPTEFATALLNGTDQNGNFKTGFAIDFAPYLIGFGDGLSIQAYRRSRAAQVLSRFHVSFGTAKGITEDDKSLRVGLGFRAILFDAGDPRLDAKLEECFNKQVLVSPNVTSLEALKKAVGAQRLTTIAAAEQCRAEAQQRNWNNSSVSVAVAPTWRSPTGSQNDLQRAGQSYWLTAAYGFEGVPGLEDRGQMLFQLRYRNDDSALDALAPPRPGDSLAFGLRVGFGGGDTNAAAEFAYVNAIPDDDAIPDDNYYRYSLIMERKVAEGIWLVASFGEESGRSAIDSPIFVLTSLKFNLGRKSVVK